MSKRRRVTKSLLSALLSDEGNTSMMRFLSLLNVITAIIIALYGVINNKDLGNISMLCSAFLGAGVGGKVLQKVSEVKNG